MPRIFFCFSILICISFYVRENISQFFLRHHFQSKGTIPTIVVPWRLEACAVFWNHTVGGHLSITTPSMSTHFYGNFCNTACAFFPSILHERGFNTIKFPYDTGVCHENYSKWPPKANRMLVACLDASFNDIRWNTRLSTGKTHVEDLVVWKVVTPQPERVFTKFRNVEVRKMRHWIYLEKQSMQTDAPNS